MKIGDLVRLNKSSPRFAALAPRWNEPSRAYVFETGLVMGATPGTDPGKAVTIMFPSGMKNVLCDTLEVLNESQ